MNSGSCELCRYHTDGNFSSLPENFALAQRTINSIDGAIRSPFRNSLPALSESTTRMHANIHFPPPKNVCKLFFLSFTRNKNYCPNCAVTSRDSQLSGDHVSRNEPALISIPSGVQAVVRYALLAAAEVMQLA